jgi:hypothetical protein
VDLWLANRPADINSRCHFFEKYGFCQYGVVCRYSQQHIEFDDNRGFKNIINEALASRAKVEKIYNAIDNDLRAKVMKSNYNFDKSNQIIELVHKYVYENGALVFRWRTGDPSFFSSSSETIHQILFLMSCDLFAGKV